MKNAIIDKLTLTIETTNGNISKEVIKSISALQRTIASHKDIKLSLSSNSLSSKENKSNPVDQYCPPNWNYWPM